MSTDDTAERPRAARHWANHLQERRRTILWAFILVALGIVSTVIIGAVVNREREAETTRADNAIIALQQACEQVRLLGGNCVTEPSEVTNNPPGPQGQQGPPGRPPTEAEIAAAVADYLLANPPPPGPVGPIGENGGQGSQGPPGPSCPGGTHLAGPYLVRLVNGSASVSAFLCVEN